MTGFSQAAIAARMHALDQCAAFISGLVGHSPKTLEVIAIGKAVLPQGQVRQSEIAFREVKHEMQRAAVENLQLEATIAAARAHD